MIENGLMSYTTFAREAGISPKTVSDLMRLRDRQPKRMSNGKCKGLDAADRADLREALKPALVTA